ncbi:MAG: hypothetical protein KDD37_03010 [Bdellovibrionales bacterium]|nr:hypothetical protein [Bdellovibrionales bacterium]
MSSVNKLFLKVSLVLLTMAPALSVAQQRSDRDGDVRRLERSVSDLQRDVDRLNRRLSRVEQYLENGNGVPGPSPAVVYSCMVVDSGHTKTFLGVGSSQLDAEFQAKSECGNTVNAVYCTSGKIKCDNNLDMDRRARGAVCLVTDSGHNRQFRGEGATLIAAEANAKIACQKSVNAVYCGNASARCELMY